MKGDGPRDFEAASRGASDGPLGFEGPGFGDRRPSRGRQSRRGQWRVAGRLARREVRRHPWRHALVVAMIFVPVLAAFATFSLLASWQIIRQQKLDFEHAGATADGATTQAIDHPFPIDPGPLPRGSVVERRVEGADWLVTSQRRPDGRGPVLAGTRVIEAPLGSRSAAQFVVQRGRLPKTSSEMLISPRLAAAGGWNVASVVESARTARRFRVVGIGVTGNEVDTRVAAVAPQPQAYWAGATGPNYNFLVGVGGGATTSLTAQRSVRLWLRDGTDPSFLEGRNLSVNQVDKLDSRVGPSVTLGAAAMSALVAVVASAAFAIASRRQLRTVGLLATAGADPATIRIALMLQGAIPGALAGIGAVAAGLAAVAVANSRGAAERVSDVAGARVIASPGGAVLAVALGLGAGVLAAWQPARAASKVPVLTALAGRRPVGPVPGRVPLAGLVAWAVGAVLVAAGFRGGENQTSPAQPFLLIGGVAAFALGGVGLAPVAVAAVGHLAGRTSGTARLALRGLARHRAQSAATVAAVGVALALPVGLLTAQAANPAEPTFERPAALPADIGRRGNAVVVVEGKVTAPDALEAEARLRSVLGPSASVVRNIFLADERGERRTVGVLDEAESSALLRGSAAVALTDGKVIALNGSPPTSSFTAAGRSVQFGTADMGQRPVRLDGVNADYLIGSRTLGKVGTSRPTAGLALLRPDPLTRSEQRAVGHIRELLGGPTCFFATPHQPTLADVRRGTSLTKTPDFTVNVSDRHRGPCDGNPSVRSDRRDLLLPALAGGSGLVAILVLTITLSLRSVDTEGERRAAIAAGASPARMRRQRALEGLVLAGLGAALALPLGWVPVTAGQAGFNARNAAFRSGPAPGGLFHFPGWEVLPILGVPVLLAGLAWLIFPALADRLRRGPRDQVIERW